MNSTLYSKWDFLILEGMERYLVLPTLKHWFDFPPGLGETGCLMG